MGSLFFFELRQWSWVSPCGTGRRLEAPYITCLALHRGARGDGKEKEDDAQHCLGEQMVNTTVQ